MFAINSLPTGQSSVIFVMTMRPFAGSNVHKYGFTSPVKTRKQNNVAIPGFSLINQFTLCIGTTRLQDYLNMINIQSVLVSRSVTR